MMCTFEAMCAVMDEEKKPELDHVTIKNDVLRKYFPKEAKLLKVGEIIHSEKMEKVFSEE